MLIADTQQMFEICETLKDISRRWEMEIETIHSVKHKLSDLSYLEESMMEIGKKAEKLADQQMVLNQMQQALVRITETYEQTEERILDNYEMPAVMENPKFQSADLSGVRQRLKGLAII